MALLGLAASAWSQRTIWRFSSICSCLHSIRPAKYDIPTIGGAPFHLYDPKQPLHGMSRVYFNDAMHFFLLVSLFMYIQGVKRDRKNIEVAKKEERCRKAFQV